MASRAFARGDLVDLLAELLPAVELAGPTAFEMREEGDSDGEGLS